MPCARVVQTHTQIRSVFSNPLALEPLGLGDVEPLLANRYEALQLDQSRPWHSPVETAVLRQRSRPRPSWWGCGR
jgi:hypothetical protein